MKKKKIIAMALVAMLSLSGLTGCSDKDKSDFTDKVNNKTSETTKKDDKKSDTTKTDSTESKDDSSTTTENTNSSSEKKDNTSSSSTKKEDTSKKDTTTKTDTKKEDTSKKDTTKTDTKKDTTTKTDSNHKHHWVDHTATKQVPRTVHHDAVYETVTIPAVTKWQTRCLGCMQWFDSLDEVTYHAFTSPVNDRCGAYAPDEVREVVITPARTEQKLVKAAYDETVYDTQTYVDYQYCSGCGQHK